MANETKIPLFRRFVIQNFPYIEQDFDALTDYQLISKVVEYLNKVIESQNGLVDDMNALTTAFSDLKDYVEHYFDNLDVQEEINNKLDQMVEDGQLTQLIAQFLSLNAIMSFPSVASMKLAENLVNGSTCETYGFYNVNDNGGAKYLVRNITNDDVVDEKTIIELYDNNLIAELIKEPEMSVKQFGAKGDNSTNDTTSLQVALNFCSSNGLVLNIPDGTYKTNGLTTNAITIKGNKCIVKAYSNANTTLLTLNGVCDIDGIEFDGDNKVNSLISNNVFKIKLTNCTFKKTLATSVVNVPSESNDEAYFENLTFTDCAGGIRYSGYPYQDPSDYQGSVKFINCTTNGSTGDSDDERIYMFTKLDYVSVQGGNFTGDSTKGATNIYQVNHGEVIGGYYHDIMRGVTLGLITEYCTVTNTINENISGGGGLHIDLVTAERVHPAGHSIIANNIVKNAYRGMYIQGKNLLINNNYIYCGTNTQSSGGVIRFNDNEDNTVDSNIILDNLYVYNLGNIANVILCGTAIVTIGKVYLDGNNIVQASVSASNYLIRGHMQTANATGSTNITINTDVILVNATASINLMLPNSGECPVIGKHYTIVRTDDSAYTVSLRCRSDNGTINGLASGIGVIPIAKGVTKVIQTGAGEYWTLS